ncbi:hypothetical protein KKF38_05200, partial [Patescibacteria group bacterium]|nr:hypothetical protein [Patescibacteria group bacterium]
KDFSKKMFAALAIILLLPACFGGDEEDSAKIKEETKAETESSEVVAKKKEAPKIFYVSEKLSECETIFFTCPQGRAFFTDKKGCGCRESSEPYNSNERGLGNMIRDHLARKLVEPSCGGGMLAEFVYIDEGVTESGDLNYDVWAVAREFCPEGGVGATFDGPVAFAIEQAEFNRVVRGFTLPSAADENAIRAAFTEKAAEWVLAKENTMRDQMIAELEGNIQARVDKLQKRLEAERNARELAEAEAELAELAEAGEPVEGSSGDEENTDVPLENVEKAE